MHLQGIALAQLSGAEAAQPVRRPRWR